MTTGWRVCVLSLLCAMTVACGRPGRDIFRDFNSRETGPWLSRGHTYDAQGALVVHVAAAEPQHAEAIARHVVTQNLALSIAPIRVVVDAASGRGERHVYRWDGRTLTADHDSSGLPPPSSNAAASHEG